MLVFLKKWEFIPCEHTKDSVRTMSVNAITSLSLYEYYYRINTDKKEKKESPIARELREYGIEPTDNEQINVAMLKKAKEVEENQGKDSTSDIPNSDRPWADLMYQLNLPFNDDPQDDIQDIKDELQQLIRGMNDEELEREIEDLQSYVEDLYVSFTKNYAQGVDLSGALSSQLNNLSLLNRANFF